MRRRDITFTLALCASIAMHGWLFNEAIRRYTRENFRIFLGGHRDSPAVIAIADDDQLGAQSGRGDAIDEAKGETLLQARQSDQTQILGSLDPEGFGSIRQEKPSESVLPKGGEVVKPKQPDVPSVQPSLGVAPQTHISTGEGFGTRSDKSILKPSVKPASSDDPQAIAPQKQQPAQTEMSTAVSPGSAARSADPAPKAETESDPVSIAGAAVFRNGKTYVQFGRKHRLTYPRLTLSGQTSLLRLSQPVIVVMRINLDPQGNVTRAEIVRSSGSIDIDQPCIVAAYSWWLEPKLDHNRLAVEDQFLFTLRFS